MHYEGDTDVEEIYEEEEEESDGDEFGVEVPRSKAYRARKKAFDVVMGDQKAQYTRLKDYLQGFLNGCRPFIRVDGCFIKLTTGQQILAATGRDGNNNIFPIAFGVVDKEDTTSWLWFLTQLRYCIGESGQFGFRGPELKKYMDAASYSYTKNGFDLAMAAMKDDCEEAYNWLAQIPPKTWARHLFDTNCKNDLVVNNISEVFNKMILNVRSKPIRTMLEGIRNKLMVKYNRTRDKAAKARWEITPFYSEKLAEAKRWSRDCTAKVTEDGLWQVTSVSGRIVAVDLKKHSCSCRKWDLTGIPCNHAVAAIMKLSQHAEDYVHDFFKKPMYEKAFSYTVYPVPGPEDWNTTDTQDIDPPVFRDRPGGNKP
nr:uncharacterized protein LOC127340602 [Lolium perenne]